MGWIKHNAIVVTHWDSNTSAFKSAHEQAKEVLGEMVSPIVGSPINGYASFLIAPDGSKEGWLDSDLFDERRAEYIEQNLRGSGLDWMLLEYGEVEADRVIDGSNVQDGDADLKKHFSK